MGTYLDKPVTDKESEDVENDTMSCGASSMQGWREYQEDTHNCILDFDTKVSLFAVYDGHGGNEVSRYAAEHLPKFVKNDLYAKGDYENALIKAYLDFDKTLIEPSVAEKLTAFREKNHQQALEADSTAEEELDELFQEAEMPISDIIKKYTSGILHNKSKDETKTSDASSSSNNTANTDEVKTSDASSSSNNTASTDDNKDIVNGVEIKAESVESAADSVVKINGTSNNDKKSPSKEFTSENNETECGPSSSSSSGSNRIRFKRRKLDPKELLLLLNDNSDDDNSDDEVYKVTEGDTDSDEESDEESDDDDDDDEEENLEDEIQCMDDEEEQAGKDSGCTAVLALLVEKKLYVANAGDSRCVVSIDGKAHDMSKDHKPEDEPELKRIIAAGGKVTNDGRVNGGLNLSRALGDHNYKKNTNFPSTEQMITALPEVNVLNNIVPGNDNFLVLACDGIWNSLTSQEVVDFVAERINEPNVKLSSICEELFDHCLAPNTLSDGTGCDNMTCVIVKLKQNHKRFRSDSENDNCDKDADYKKLKSDSTEPKPVQ